MNNYLLKLRRFLLFAAVIIAACAMFCTAAGAEATPITYTYSGTETTIYDITSDVKCSTAYEIYSGHLPVVREDAVFVAANAYKTCVKAYSSGTRTITFENENYKNYFNDNFYVSGNEFQYPVIWANQDTAAGTIAGDRAQITYEFTINEPGIYEFVFVGFAQIKAADVNNYLKDRGFAFSVDDGSISQVNISDTKGVCRAYSYEYTGTQAKANTTDNNVNNSNVTQMAYYYDITVELSAGTHTLKFYHLFSSEGNNLTGDGSRINFAGFYVQKDLTDEELKNYVYSSDDDSSDIDTSGTCGENLTWTYNNKLTSIIITGSGVMTDYASASELPWYDLSDRITAFVIDDSMTHIGNNAFAGLTKLTNVNFTGSESLWNTYFTDSSGFNPDGIAYTVNYDYRILQIDSAIEAKINALPYSPSLFTTFLKLSEKDEAFSFPGLGQGFVPQGMDIWDINGDGTDAGHDTDDAVVISGYFSEYTWCDCSVLMVFNIKTGAYIGEYYLKNSDGSNYTGHAGGVAITSKNLFISNGSQLLRIPLSAFSAAGATGNIKIVDSINVPSNASFCNYSGGYLWVGDFYMSGKYETNKTNYVDAGTAATLGDAWCVGYALDGDDTEFGSAVMNTYNSKTYAVPDLILSIDIKIQGFAVCGEYVALSTSYGRANNSSIYLYKNIIPADIATITDNISMGSNTVPVIYVKTSNADAEYHAITSIPMAEGLANYNGRLFILHESGASMYCNDGGANPTNRIWIMDMPTNELEYTVTAEDTCSVYVTSLATNKTNIIIPEKVTIDGKEYNVTEIAEAGFQGCNMLRQVTMPDSIIAMGKSSFASCTGLTQVVLSENLTIISQSAFNGCTKLTQITLPDKITRIDDFSFSGCTGLTQITFPDNLISIAGYAFQNCTGLTQVTFPASINNINNCAFKNCTNILNGYYKGNVTNWSKVKVGTTDNGAVITAPVCLGISFATISLENNISINFYVPSETVNSLTTSSLNINYRGQDRTLACEDGDFTVDGVAYKKYVFGGVVAKSIADPMDVTFTGTDAIGAHSGSTLQQYSVAQYCLNQLKDTESDANLKTLGADLLNYGTAAQYYFSYNTDKPASSGMTAAQRALATTTEPTLTNSFAITSGTVEAPSVTFGGVSLALERAVDINVFFAYTCALPDISFEIWVDYNNDGARDDSEIHTIDCAEYGEFGSITNPSNNVTYTTFRIGGIAAKDMRAKVYITAKVNGVSVSETLTYSIESYAQRMQSNSNWDMAALAVNMMKYSDSAVKYFAGING